MRHCFSAFMLLLFPLLAHPAERCNTAWPLWEEFAGVHIQTDGRVIDHGAGSISTSEGQSYALFFSLVAGDRERFERILKWTNDNLSQGDLGQHLPAWKWGAHSDGRWRVFDANPASDADLWIAYTLYQAATIWNERSYRDTAAAMLKNIAEHEVLVLPKLGNMLLPAPYGFELDAETWRLNPSYLPVQLLRYFASLDPHGVWDEIAGNTLKMIVATSKRGRVPDWVLYSSAKGFQPDTKRGRYSSYDAIRAYLWWAMLNRHDRLFDALRPYMTGAEQFHPQRPRLPELVDVADGSESGQAPIGFTAALAPYHLVQYGYHQKIPASLEDDAGYYNYALSLFGYGWLERRYRFNPDGSLHVQHGSCPTLRP